MADSLKLVMVNDKNGSGTPNWGDSIRFDITTTERYPWIHVEVTQNGQVVAVANEGMFPESLDDGVIGLYSGPWQSGAAEAVATLERRDKRGRYHALASMRFHVDA